MSRWTFRVAQEADAPDLLAIYAPYIATPVTFEEQLPSEEEFARRIREYARDYPYLVCLRDGQPVGYAYAHRAMERAAYRWNAELSIYLAPEAAGQGVGKRLYQALEELLGMQGVRNLYGVVTAPNPASEALHRACGFRLIGVHQASGYKCGRWRDVLWYEKRLPGQEGPSGPREPEPFSQMAQRCPQEVTRVLEQYRP